jgi:predicted nucleotidyltransferase component of viral defense system
MKISIYNSLKKKQHKDIAYLQDLIVDIVYNIFPNIVFHGGTSIWRCYNGNRFSEDLDFYLLRQNNIKQKLQKEIIKKKLNLIKFKETNNLIFSKISLNKIIVQLEIRLLDQEDKIFNKSIPTEYNNVDGSTITIFCLSEKDLLFEKANAFRNRRLIRDIYDVYFLSNFIKLNSSEIKEFYKIFNDFKEPLDESNLKAIVYRGAIPTYSQMLNAIKRRL